MIFKLMINNLSMMTRSQHEDQLQCSFNDLHRHNNEVQKNNPVTSVVPTTCHLFQQSAICILADMGRTSNDAHPNNLPFTFSMNCHLLQCPASCMLAKTNRVSTHVLPDNLPSQPLPCIQGQIYTYRENTYIHTYTCTPSHLRTSHLRTATHTRTQHRTLAFELSVFH